MKSGFIGFIFFFTCSSLAVDFVQESQFRVGSTWSWLYSEKKTEDLWSPYYLEQYQVVAKQGKQITIEMSSRPADSNGPLLSHHRFQVDFSHCERMNSGGLHNSLTVKLWTLRSSGGWQLVNNQHQGLIFTEKFNCLPKAVHSVDEIILDGVRFELFQSLKNEGEFLSWYFSNHDQVGVAGRKLFEPTGSYKFEFLDIN